MKSIALQQNIESLPVQVNEPIIETYEGILNSEYKQVAKNNFFNAEPHTIFAARQRAKSHQYRFPSYAGAMIKLALFATVLAWVLA
ncbi:MAG: hypothetical protein HKO90_06245 [Flavobacteriaceae bacterium]|nr:hypothetical protein [Bacteroidia bacterium]NNK87864.1 hypothetical protein [Flavobacteriaceae bacterium]